ESRSTSRTAGGAASSVRAGALARPGRTSCSATNTAASVTARPLLERRTILPIVLPITQVDARPGPSVAPGRVAFLPFALAQRFQALAEKQSGPVHARLDGGRLEAERLRHLQRREPLHVPQQQRRAVLPRQLVDGLPQGR